MNATLEHLHEQRPGLQVLGDERLVPRARENLRSVGESRRRPLGTDTPQRIEANVTTHDGLLAELSASLVAVSVDPVQAVARAHKSSAWLRTP
jgi:hypothetical protein